MSPELQGHLLAFLAAETAEEKAAKLTEVPELLDESVLEVLDQWMGFATKEVRVVLAANRAILASIREVVSRDGGNADGGGAIAGA
ncbi:MAG: hypothetical protein FJW39_28540 [Acidobacteria bacterium]|nr:hypothetical protein [Acidobacteriota bacterium]